jgi:hypothetical protein
MAEKKKKKKEGIPDDVLDFLGQIAMGGAAEGRVSPGIEETTRHRFDTQFAGTKAALGVGRGGPLRPTGDPRAVGAETGRPKFGSLAEAIPLLGDNMDRMSSEDIEVLSQWLKTSASAQEAVDKFKASKGWHRK